LRHRLEGGFDLSLEHAGHLFRLLIFVRDGGFVRVNGVKGLCAQVIRLRVSYNQNDEALSRNSLMYMSKADLTIVVH